MGDVDRFEFSSLLKMHAAILSWQDNEAALAVIRTHAESRGIRVRLVYDIGTILARYCESSFETGQIASILKVGNPLSFTSRFTVPSVQSKPWTREKAFEYMYRIHDIDENDINKFLPQEKHIDSNTCEQIIQESLDTFTNFIYETNTISELSRREFELIRDSIFTISDLEGGYISLRQVSGLMGMNPRYISDALLKLTPFLPDAVKNLEVSVMKYYWDSIGTGSDVKSIKDLLRDINSYRDTDSIDTDLSDLINYDQNFRNSLLDDLYKLVIETAGYDFCDMKPLPSKYLQWARHHMEENKDSFDTDDMSPTTIFNNLNRIPHMWMAERGNSIDGNPVTREDVIREQRRQLYLRKTIKYLIFGLNRDIDTSDIPSRLRSRLGNTGDINTFIKRVNRIKDDPDGFVLETYRDFYLSWRQQSNSPTKYVRYTNILDFL
jgi:hypothetical protein